MSITGMPVFFSAYFYVAQIKVEYAMERALNHENLEVITLPVNEVIWLKDHKEILVNYHPFDVKSYEQKGTFIVLKGLFDVKEKELKSRLIACSKENGHSGKQDLFQVIFLCFYPHFKNLFTHQYFLQTQPKFCVFDNTNTRSKFASLPAPPPRYIAAS